MPEVKQITVEASPASKSPLGARNEKNLQKSFSASPIYSGDLTDDERREEYERLALIGEVTNGLGVNTFNRDFVGTSNDPTPELSDVKTGGGGLPSSPYVPNITSPGPGSVFPNDQAPYEGELPDPGVEYGSGLGGQTSPSDTSEKIASQKIGQYISGRSYQGSDGKG
ncbi:hypothetical protein CMI47_06930 [Candidatus Pacearchaeota archaeon]|nr:hypothetical protein [Candidatus Pacearchaeota archaeon]|tara:strand:- start:5627 stop:6130 length:504 start_codon:yes stop_codon:yes gene_type:complete